MMLDKRKWGIEEMTGYKPKTTFWQDFCIADFPALYGDSDAAIAAVKETYERAFEEWKDDVVYLTEFIMVINWKSWEWGYSDPDHKAKDEKVGRVYADLFYKAQDWVYDHWKGEDLSYYCRTVD